jgi:hypothetical protein
MTSDTVASCPCPVIHAGVFSIASPSLPSLLGACPSTLFLLARRSISTLVAASRNYIRLSQTHLCRRAALRRLSRLLHAVMAAFR